MSSIYAKYLISTNVRFDPAMGRRLLYARRKMDILQKDFCVLLGISQTGLSKIEMGKVRDSALCTGLLKSVLGEHFKYVFTGAGKEKYEPFQWSDNDKHGHAKVSRNA